MFLCTHVELPVSLCIEGENKEILVNQVFSSNTHQVVDASYQSGGELTLKGVNRLPLTHRQPIVKRRLMINMVSFPEILVSGPLHFKLVISKRHFCLLTTHCSLSTGPPGSPFLRSSTNVA